MSSFTGLSPNNPRDYLGASVALVTAVTRNRAPTGADFRQPETGKLYPFSTIWVVGKDPTTGVQGDLWCLSKIVANVAYWVQFSNASVGPILSVTVDQATAPGVNPVEPDVDGNVTVSASAVANHSVPIETRTRALHAYNVEAQYSTSSSATDATKSGLSHYNSTQFSVDANGFVQLVNSTVSGVRNLGITYNAGTGIFTICAQNGSTLSASNPAYVTLPSKSAPGTLITILVTANQTFIDDNGASTIIGNLFGLTTSIAYVQDLPFWIYAVLNDAETAISFMLSRYPNTATSPVSGKIGKTGSAVADSQGSFFALENPTVTDYDENPCIVIGGIRMRMSASDDWTVQTLANTDGIGKLYQGVYFSMSAGQFGAATSSFMKGAPPTFVSQALSYTVSLLNQLTFTGILLNCSANGGDSAELSIASPYLCTGGTTGNGRVSTTGANTIIASVEGSTGNNNDTTFFYDGAFVDNAILNDDFTVNAGSSIYWNVLVSIVFT